MKKWIYKLIFLIVFTVVGLFMLPKKEVKALEQDFAPILIKTTWVSTYYDRENTQTHEFVVTYKLDGIFINNLNRGEYFLITMRSIGIVQGELHRNTNSLIIEDIQTFPQDNSTKFYVRVTLTHPRVAEYGGVANIDTFFRDDSAFYVGYDIYTDAYDAGYSEGLDEGYNIGYGDGFADGCNEGYNDGYRDGYTGGHYEGYSEGLDEGYNNGYGEGYINGRTDGYNNGYDVGYINGRTDGYNNGYNNGYNVGYDDGYMDGKEYGINFGREYWYEVGYEVGFGQGRIAGYDEGYSVGYSDGLSETTDKNFGRLLGGLFTGIGAFLAINLLPGISIGAIIAVPIVFGIIAFILGRKKD